MDGARSGMGCASATAKLGRQSSSSSCADRRSSSTAQVGKRNEYHSFRDHTDLCFGVCSSKGRISCSAVGILSTEGVAGSRWG